MRVILLSPKPINDLKKLAETFNVIQNKHLHLDTCNEPVMENNNFGQIVYLRPYDDSQAILLEWEIPIDLQHDVQYLSFLLTSSHPSSLHSTLFDKGLGVLLNPVKACKRNSFIFSLQINLTDIGVKQINNVIGYAFDYLNLIKQKGVSQELFYNWQNDKMENCLLSFNANKQIDIYDLSKVIMDEGFETFPEKCSLFRCYQLSVE